MSRRRRDLRVLPPDYVSFQSLPNGMTFALVTAECVAEATATSTERNHKMKNNWILTIVLALITTPFASAAQVRALSEDSGAAPTPPILADLHNADAAELADVLAVQPLVPLGPPDLLKEYEQAMASTAQGFNAEVSQIAEAVEQKKITEDQGEYLCKEAYQLATMQFQVFSGLHDILEEKLSQTPAAAPPANPAPATGLSGSRYHNEAHTVGAGSRAI